MTYLNRLGAHRLRIRTYVRCYQKILGGCGSKVLSIHYKMKRETYLPGSSSLYCTPKDVRRFNKACLHEVKNVCYIGGVVEGDVHVNLFLNTMLRW